MSGVTLIPGRNLCPVCKQCLLTHCEHSIFLITRFPQMIKEGDCTSCEKEMESELERSYG